MTELNYLAESDATLNESGSLCPATKAADMIGDRWTLLLLRELLLGTFRYNAFQRALPRISPTVLSKRLKQMESDLNRKTLAHLALHEPEVFTALVEKVKELG